MKYLRKILPVVLLVSLCIGMMACAKQPDATEGRNRIDSSDSVTLSTGRIIPLSASEEENETTDATETEEDLGGPFSVERLSYAGRMTLLGMGMVFAVLALQWMILVIFRRILNSKTEKAKTPDPEPPLSPVSPTPAGDDPAVVAAITAAIAAMIESDPDLSGQFADGFRVVSFKRRTGKTGWNQ